jgi:hypothetical protein
MKIVTLIENLANRSGLIAEHGYRFILKQIKARSFSILVKAFIFTKRKKA